MLWWNEKFIHLLHWKQTQKYTKWKKSQYKEPALETVRDLFITLHLAPCIGPKTVCI